MNHKGSEVVQITRMTCAWIQEKVTVTCETALIKEGCTKLLDGFVINISDLTDLTTEECFSFDLRNNINVFSKK